LSSKARILLDRTMSEPLPVWVWVVEHPEGNILVDTGAGSGLSRPEYLRPFGRVQSWMMRQLAQFEVAAQDEASARLASCGIKPKSIQKVVLTHLHCDHVDGLGAFQDREIIVADDEWRHPHFAAFPLMPEKMLPNRVALRSGVIPGFQNAYPITRAGDVFLVATPGHTFHHCSVLVISAHKHYLIAGDAVYSQAQLLADRDAGVDADFRLAAASRHALRVFARKNPTVFLPSHDPEAAKRLRAGSILEVA